MVDLVLSATWPILRTNSSVCVPLCVCQWRLSDSELNANSAPLQIAGAELRTVKTLRVVGQAEIASFPLHTKARDRGDSYPGSSAQVLETIWFRLSSRISCYSTHPLTRP
ncbi:hypothetical protein VTK73DRAFT_2366 [Phialemonium thermophilum]|uniref:Secreted protein n=1 Tax=Phialemonium thermophilum TaxID=223376 RepID=A0ABR3X5B5_9PEZI